MPQYVTINTTAETICFISAVILLRKDTVVIWRTIIVFLLITCITELAAIPIKKRYIADPIHTISNIWLYNILLLFQAMFFSLMFAYLFKNHKHSKPILFGALLVIYVLFVYEVFLHGIFEYNNLTQTVMSVLLVFYSFFYFYNLLKSDNNINLKYSPEFWWVVGTLFFYFGGTACNIFYEKIKAVLIIHKHYLGYIYNALNIILYSCWSYSFICRKWLSTRTITSKA